MEKENNLEQKQEQVVEKKKNQEPKTIVQLIEELKVYTDKDKIAKFASKIYKLKKNYDELENRDSIEPSVIQEFESLYSKVHENLEWVLWANHKAKQKILEELMDIYEKEEGQILFDRFNQLKEQWKNIGPIPQKEAKKIVDQYRDINKKIYDKCQPLYEEKEKEKENNYQAKLAVCEKIEAMLEPENWKEASDIVIKLQKNWDSLGMVPREKSQEIWERFRKACDDFFTKRNKFYKDYSEQKKKNLEQKLQFCEEAESLAESIDWTETSHKLKELQKKWNEIGPVPKGKNKDIFKRFRTACDHFFKAQKDHFKELEDEKQENYDAKVKICEELESLGEMEDDAKFRKIRELQKQWKEIGPAPRKRENEIWKRFRVPIDAFFKNREDSYQARLKEMEQNVPLKEEFCRLAEELADSEDWRETSRKLKDLQKQWKETGSLPREKENELWQRFRSACDHFFKRLKENRQSKNESLKENLEQKKALCFQAELISGVEVTDEESEERGKWLLFQLKENFWFKVIDENAGFSERAERLKELQREWKTIGPVPREESDRLWKKFQKACQHFFDRSSD